MPLYEGAAVNIDHPPRHDPSRERSFVDGFGELRNVRLRDDGLWGDLHFKRTHPMAPVFIETAERFPRKAGLSHNAEGTTEERNGGIVVESIANVRSVDIVGVPASTSGIFESLLEQAAGDEPTMSQLAGALANRLAQSEASGESLEAVQVVLAGFVVLATKAENGAGRKVDRLKRDIKRFMGSLASTLGIDVDGTEPADRTEDEERVGDAIDRKSKSGGDGDDSMESLDAPSWSPDYRPAPPVPVDPQRKREREQAWRKERYAALREAQENEPPSWSQLA